MRKIYAQLALSGGLFLAGCGMQPSLSQAPSTAAPVAAADVMAVDYQLQPATDGYALASVDTASQTGAAIAVKSCTASSTLNDYFKLAYLTDGNISSAWAPATTDTAPTLTFDLGSAHQLSGISLKMSHVNATVDVAVAVGGVWKTVASGLAPVPTVLSDLNIQACQADHVRLTFKGTDLADLRVCEVQFFGQAGQPAPSPLPSTSPSTLPSPLPSALPSAMPSQSSSGEDNSPCTFTGGGWLPVVDAEGEHKICFGFVAKAAGSACQGSLELDDLTTGKAYLGSVETVVCHGNLVTFSGSLTTGAHFTATVVDEGRHGRADTLSFSTDDGVLFCGKLAEETHHGGRIKIHKKTVVRFEDVDEDRELQQDFDQLGLQVSHEQEHYVVGLQELQATCEREAFEDDAVGPRKPHGHRHADD